MRLLSGNAGSAWDCRVTGECAFRANELPQICFIQTVFHGPSQPLSPRYAGIQFWEPDLTYHSVKPLGASCAFAGAMAALFVLAPVAQAQAFRSGFPAQTMIFKAGGEAATPETVRLLHGLAKIESDIRLGMLFAVDHVKDPGGSHLSDPHEEIWPDIRDGLLAAGAADFDALLVQLEEAKDEAAVLAVGSEVLFAIVKARAALHPTDADIGASVLELTREAATEINPTGPTGPTEIASYQDAWSLLTVARGEVELLLHAQDPILARAAVKMVLALDDVIIFMPDPEAKTPVAFDPAVIADAATKLEALLDGEV